LSTTVLLSTVWSVPSGIVIAGAKVVLTVCARVKALRTVSPLAARSMPPLIVDEGTRPTSSRPTMSAAL
jgi:hypothetical protein